MIHLLFYCEDSTQITALTAVLQCPMHNKLTGKIVFIKEEYALNIKVCAVSLNFKPLHYT